MVSLHVGLADAWGATLREFWALHGVFLETHGKGRKATRFRTAADVRGLEDHLRGKGIL